MFTVLIPAAISLARAADVLRLLTPRSPSRSTVFAACPALPAIALAQPALPAIALIELMANIPHVGFASFCRCLAATESPAPLCCQNDVTIRLTARSRADVQLVDLGFADLSFSRL